MSWTPIDFHGIISLEPPLVTLLNQYLEEQEHRLALAIIEVVPPLINETVPPTEMTRLKLSEAIDAFCKRNYQQTNHSAPLVQLEDWKKAVSHINAALWQYEETIEGCISELFHQLDLTGIELWHSRLSQVVSDIKDMLIHRMDDLIWGMRRLEEQLWKSRLACEYPNSNQYLWLKFTSLWTSLLDRDLLKSLEKNKEFLKTQHQKFIKRYKGYQGLLQQLDTYVEKFDGYKVFSGLERETRNQWIELYKLLKLWELNRSARALPSKDFIIALRNALSIDKATGIFKEYYKALKASLFEKSLSLKKTPEIDSEPFPVESLEAQINECQVEVHMLASTLSHYRAFLLSSDPDPYARTRFGFSERVIGPEPAQTKPLLHLGYDVETLSELFDKLAQSIKNKPSTDKQEMESDNKEIQQLLHEMGQPLITHRMMRAKAEKVLDKLNSINELGSFDTDIVDEVGKVFSKLLRADWKYHVLYGIPLFHQLYAIHQGLIKPNEDRHHTNRIAKFNKLIHQVQEWVQHQKAQRHLHDIELDINDIKGYLQDFLGYVQRVCFQEPGMTKDKASVLQRSIAQQLLEYRYLFGNFFYQLRQNEAEGPFIRKQFLFVDQYFETIEYKLYEFSQMEFNE